MSCDVYLCMCFFMDVLGFVDNYIGGGFHLFISIYIPMAGML